MKNALGLLNVMENSPIFAKRVLAIVEAFVCPSVRLTLRFYQNGASQDYVIFTAACGLHKD